eukprot:GHVU01011685.1.p1 GENE.GHVU01011685.1~~GHVU01011685.1.p1  ORF type:complete len:126 (+),score=13.60 GHVU01011685.1:1-378(+)
MVPSTSPQANPPKAKELMQALVLGASAGKDVTYYMMAAGPKWEDHMLKAVETPNPFTWAHLRTNIIEDNQELHSATLISPDEGSWRDMLKHHYTKDDKPAKTLNFVAITATVSESFEGCVCRSMP